MTWNRFCIMLALVVTIQSSWLGPAAYGQVTDVTISGVVKDQTGAVLPGVSITVTETQTGSTRATLTEQNGCYQVLALSPGIYQIKADLSGFQRVVAEGVKLDVGDHRTVDLV